MVVEACKGRGLDEGEVVIREGEERSRWARLVVAEEAVIVAVVRFEFRWDGWHIKSKGNPRRNCTGGQNGRGLRRSVDKDVGIEMSGDEREACVWKGGMGRRVLGNGSCWVMKKAMGD